MKDSAFSIQDSVFKLWYIWVVLVAFSSLNPKSRIPNPHHG